MLEQQLLLLGKIFKKGFYIFAALLLFFLIIEIIRAFQTLYSVHPLLAWSLGFLGLVLVVHGIMQFVKLVRKFRVAPSPPNPDKYRGADSTTYSKAYLGYLEDYVNRLVKNPNLSPDMQSHLTSILSDQDMFSGDKELSNLVDKISTIDREVITPALNELHDRAENIIKNTVRDTMLSVMLNPFKAADVFYVIYRNGVMFFQLVELYNQRPGMAQTVRIFRDVMKIVATVHVLSFTERFTENLVSKIPVIDNITDDIIQGIGAGLLTTAVGKATIQRCRVYAKWDTEDQIKLYRKTTGHFLIYVKSIFSQDILPTLSWPWRQAWKTLTKVFSKTEKEMEQIVEKDLNAKPFWWKIWSKENKIEVQHK